MKKNQEQMKIKQDEVAAEVKYLDSNEVYAALRVYLPWPWYLWNHV